MAPSVAQWAQTMQLIIHKATSRTWEGVSALGPGRNGIAPWMVEVGKKPAEYLFIDVGKQSLFS